MAQSKKHQQQTDMHRHSTSNVDDLEMELKTLQEIHRLRNEIHQLNVAERGGGYGGGGGSKAAATPPKAATPSSPTTKDHLVLNNTTESSSSSTCLSNVSYKRKVCCTVVAIILIVGVVSIVTDAFDFMKQNGIELIPSEPGSTTAVSMEQLAVHNTPEDCWVAIHGNVYDFTIYANRHPAGPEWVTDLAGTDGTEAYSEFHSISLLRSIQGDMIGPLLVDGGEGSSNGFANAGSGVGGMTNTNPNNNDEPINCDAFVGNDITTSCITMEELSSHNTPDNCWVGLHGHVYDLTDYANRHPAGPNWVTKLAGGDGTAEYRKFHSSRLLNSVSQYLVGALEGTIPNDSSIGGEEGLESLSDSED